MRASEDRIIMCVRNVVMIDHSQFWQFVHNSVGHAKSLFFHNDHL